MILPSSDRVALAGLLGAVGASRAMMGRGCKTSEFLRRIDTWRSTKRHSRCARNVTVRAPSFKSVTVGAPIRAACISGERRYCISRDAKSRLNRGG